MLQSWKTLQESRKLHELSLAEGMELLLHSEEQARDNRRFGRLQKHAGFRYKASLLGYLRAILYLRVNQSSLQEQQVVVKVF